LQTGTGNITGDPRFINHSEKDYRLNYGSICFNSGENQHGQMFSKDITGNDRIISGTVDMGAFEMAYGIGSPNVTITSMPDIIAYHISDVSLWGTNNSHVLGLAWWSNITAQTAGNTIPDYSSGIGWSADISLVHGVNQISVYGSNYTGNIAWDTTIINRENYNGAVPVIETNALVFPSSGCVLTAPEYSDIIWDPLKIHDDIDGTNLMISLISILQSNDFSWAETAASNVSNVIGINEWLVPMSLISDSTNYVIRFDVVDSSSLTCSMTFINNPFSVIPEPMWILLLILSASLWLLRNRH